MDRNKSLPPVLMPLLLLTLLAGCKTSLPPIAPPSVQPPQRPPLPQEGRQPPTPSLCSPTCSAGLMRERENWRASLMNAAPLARPANAGLARPSPDR